MCSSLNNSKNKGEIRIVDGGFSTQLSLYVGEKVDGDPLWTSKFLATNPEAVLAVHLDFLRAGADIIETNTYQASILGFMKYLNLTAEESSNLITEAVNIAKEAISIYSKENNGDKKLIIGSCGPYGAALHNGSEYTGVYDSDVTSETIKNYHKPRLEALLKGGVDFICFETIPNDMEADALVDLLKDYPQVKAWLSFSCRQDGKSLANGANFKDVATRCYFNALPGQLIAVGVNCIGPRFVLPLLEQINKDRQDDRLPLVAYPNSGEHYDAKEGWRILGDLDPVAKFIPDWLNIGVRYVGGCCRTYAKDITKIREIVKLWEKENMQ